MIGREHKENTSTVMGETQSKINPTLFGVSRVDSGYLYLIENGRLLKIGKTRNPKKRMREAKTWLPTLNVLGIKPFWSYSALEQFLQLGLSRYWVDGEWFDIDEPEFREFFIAEFVAYSDTDRDSNSVNFIYSMNGSGMSEFVMEKGRQGLSRRKFLDQESQANKSSG